MDAELARFFAHWVPLLRGERSTSELESALGKSNSSAADLNFYRTLMQRNATGILSALFPATRAAFLTWAPGKWLDTTAQYEREHPARHHDPNEFGRDFPIFVSERRTIDPDLRAPLSELCDYEWLVYAFGAGVPAEASPTPAFESFALRHYDHDVPALLGAARAGELVRPTRAAVTVLCYRDPQTGRARALYPSCAALLALAQRASLTPPNAVSMATEEIAKAERELEWLGVLKSVSR